MQVNPARNREEDSALRTIFGLFLPTLEPLIYGTVSAVTKGSAVGGAGPGARAVRALGGAVMGESPAPPVYTLMPIQAIHYSLPRIYRALPAHTRALWAAGVRVPSPLDAVVWAEQLNSPGLRRDHPSPPASPGFAIRDLLFPCWAGVAFSPLGPGHSKPSLALVLPWKGSQHSPALQGYLGWKNHPGPDIHGIPIPSPWQEPAVTTNKEQPLPLCSCPGQPAMLKAPALIPSDTCTSSQPCPVPAQGIHSRGWSRGTGSAWAPTGATPFPE